MSVFILFVGYSRQLCGLQVAKGDPGVGNSWGWELLAVKEARREAFLLNLTGRIFANRADGDLLFVDVKYG